MLYNHRIVILVIILTVLVSNVSISLAEVLVITSSEENTLPVFEVYNVTEDRVDTVEKVGHWKQSCSKLLHSGSGSWKI